MSIIESGFLNRILNYLLILNRLQTLYAHPDDIDFFVGGMSEKPVSGGLLGWTFLCVVGDQFARVKKGDRFFYDIGGQPGSFTPGTIPLFDL